jgi:class 3 adenylate cyclase/tetratricopeptide (TPR) repeat protein
VQVCPNCGESNVDRFRFCGVCGTALASKGDPGTGTRKTVTVLFCDLVGSTELGSRLDPEVLRGLMTRYFDEVKAVIERHGGVVEKYIGDAVMAVFGVPRVHEDDAVRAARAALEIRDALGRLNDDLQARHGFSLHARTGINTGEVVAGDPSDHQKLVSGDAVNVAARLEQAASPDEIIIGPETEYLVRDFAVSDPIAPLRLKGKEEPAAAFRLRGVMPSEQRRVPRMHSPFVGREREIALLSDAIYRSAAERSCYLFTILGAAGIGKSRLLSEVLTKVASEATVVQGQCLSYGEGITFWPLAQVVRAATGIKESDTASDAVAKITALMETVKNNSVHADRVAQLIGLVTASAPPEALFSATRALLESIAGERLLIAVFEDIHWAEGGLLAFIEHVADWSRAAPIVLLCTARPELLDDQPGWGGGKLNATSVLLEPLGQEQSKELIANLLETSALGPKVRDRITTVAEGNCLFIEEMIAMVVERGVVTKRGTHWVQSGALTRLDIPPTIQALLAARLDRLAPDERKVMERAAVIGHTFYSTAVAELSPPDERAAVPTRLMALVRKELIRPDRSDFIADDAYLFRHALIRDAAYDGMAKTMRAELHERFARWLETTAAGRAYEYSEFIGHHLDQARRYLVELGLNGERRQHIAEDAVRYLGVAAGRALVRGDYGAAVALFDRTIVITPPAALSPQTLVDLGIALKENGELSRSLSVLDRATTLAKDVGDIRSEWRAIIEASFVRTSLGLPGAVSDAAHKSDRAIAVLGQLGDEMGLAKAWRLRAEIDHIHCLYDRGKRACDRAFDFANHAGDEAEQVRSLTEMWSLVAAGSTSIPDAVRFFEGLAEQLEARGILWFRGSPIYALLVAMQGRFDEARAWITKTQENQRDRGDLLGMATNNAELGRVELLANDPRAAEKAFRAFYNLSMKMGERAVMSTYVVDLAEALCRLHRYDEAHEFTVISEQAAHAEDVASQAGWRYVRAKVLAHRGQFQLAVAMASESVAMLEASEWPEGHGYALMALADVFVLSERQAEAATVLHRAVNVFNRKGIVVLAEKAQRTLSELTGDGDIHAPN